MSQGIHIGMRTVNQLGSDFMTSGSLWFGGYAQRPMPVFSAVCAYCGQEKEKSRCENCGACKNEPRFVEAPGRGIEIYHDEHPARPNLFQRILEFFE